MKLEKTLSFAGESFHSQIASMISSGLAVLTFLSACLVSVFFNSVGVLGSFGISVTPAVPVIGIFKLLEPDQSYRLDQRVIFILASMTIIVLPAILLVRFYFRIATTKVPASYATVGWVASAAYHAALAYLVYRLHGTTGPIGTPVGSLPEFPFWFLHAAAVLVSLVLLVWSRVALTPRTGSF